MSWLPDWLTGYDSENAQRAAAADARLREINQSRIDAGFYSPDQAAQINANYAAQGGFDANSQRESIDQAFVQGIDEGRAKTNSFLWGVVGQFFKSVPTVVWVGLALFVAWRLGWLKKILGKLS